MRTIVCGGRDFDNWMWLFHVLDVVEPPITVLIHGAYRGADSLAKAWAIDRGIQEIPFPAEWDLYGKGAGPRRNTMMLLKGGAQRVIAFPGGSGTTDMITQAMTHSVPVVIPNLQDFQNLLRERK